jgi:predicted CxxxxCH...CXXCH cytochrome family protein
VDGITQVTGYSGTNPNLLAQAGDPGWSSSTATCATSYCHGATLQGGSYKQPAWRTVNGSQVTCAGCHGMPPNSGPEVIVGQTAHAVHVTRERLDCSNCHPGYGYSVAAGRYVVDPITHVNGKRDAIIAGVRRDGWTTCSNASCHVPYQE